MGNPEGAGWLHKKVEQGGTLLFLCMVLSEALYVIKNDLAAAVSRVRSPQHPTLSAYWLSCALPEAEQKLEFRFRVCGQGCKSEVLSSSRPGLLP